MTSSSIVLPVIRAFIAMTGLQCNNRATTKSGSNIEVEGERWVPESRGIEILLNRGRLLYKSCKNYPGWCVVGDEREEIQQPGRPAQLVPGRDEPGRGDLFGRMDAHAASPRAETHDVHAGPDAGGSARGHDPVMKQLVGEDQLAHLDVTEARAPPLRVPDAPESGPRAAGQRHP